MLKSEFNLNQFTNYTRTAQYHVSKNPHLSRSSCWLIITVKLMLHILGFQVSVQVWPYLRQTEKKINNIQDSK